MNYGADSESGSEQRETKIPERTQLRELRRRLSLAPHNTGLRLRLAHWLAEHGRRNEALEELRTLVRLDPNHLGARKLREELARGSKTAELAPSPNTSEALH